MKLRNSLLATALFLTFFVPVYGQPGAGVYRVVNASYGTVLTEDFVNKELICSTKGTDNTTYEQLWELSVSGNSYTFRNVYTGNYIQQKSEFYTTYTTASSSATFYVGANSYNSGYYNIMNSSGAGTAMHCDASANVVLWYPATASGVSASEWTFESVSLTTAQITAARAGYQELVTAQSNASTYNTALQTFFSDYACTTLRSTYASMSDANLRSAMSSLPATLQDMAVKIKNNAWGTYEQQYRVRSYQPYSDADAWGTKLNTFKYSYMNNPTGIYGNSRDLLYVFVDGDVPSNATLYLDGVTGTSVLTSATSGVALTKGLNVIPIGSNGDMQFVVYTADTYNTSKSISDFSAIKIHIEGGTVNGFWEKGVNSDADWVAFRTFSTASSIQVKGERMLFHMDKDYIMASDCCYSTISDAIEWWDNLVLWEQELLGIIDDGTGVNDDFYPTRFNNLLCAISLTDGYQSATDYRTQYAASYICNLLPKSNMMSGADNAWGPAHENGHVHQGAINMVGCSEVSNNLFSNLVVANLGKYLSRGGTIAQMAAEFNNGTSWLERSGGTKLRMYWQLYLYYHMAGNNTAFYPTLFKLLRNDPMVKGNSTNGADESMKFVEKCCEAAGEDLTEFFTAWGFFVPLNNVYCGDYGDYYVTLTQSQIDATKSTISQYTKKNSAIIFIEDRIANIARTDGVSGNKVTNEVAIGEAGEVGQYTEYVNGAASTASGYAYSQLATTINMVCGSGGVGFKVYDASGNLATFSNNKSFSIPSTLASQNFTIVAMQGDGTSVAVTSATQGTTAQQLAALNSAITEASVYLNMEDATGTKVGYYRSSVLSTLSSLVSQANAAISSSNSSVYGTMTEQINAELLNLSNVVTTFADSNYYSLTNYLYPTYSAALSSTNLTNTTAATSADAKKWAFISTGTAGQYYIKSKSGYYVDAIAQSSTATATTTSQSGAMVFSVVANGDGTFYIKSVSEGDYGCLHCDASKNMVGWDSGSDASHWYITMTEGTVVSDSKYSLGNLITSTQTLIGNVCTYEQAAASAVTLQTTSSTSAGYLSTNAQESSEGAIANLIDGSTTNFFHSTWSTSSSAQHYLQVDLGSGVTLQQFTFGYTTRPSNFRNKPTAIVISGSNNGNGFTTITTLTSSDSNPLPSNTTSQESFTSGTIDMGSAYRYIRFTVTATNTGDYTTSGYPFFSLSEFGLSSAGASTIVINSSMPNVTESLINAAISAKTSAQTVYDNASSTESDYTSAIATLQAAYDALYAASVNTTQPEVPDTEAYNALNSAITTASAINVTAGTDPGYYPESQVTALATALATAQTVLAASSSTTSDYTSATTALNSAIDGLEMIMPEAGKYYIFESANTSGSYCDGSYMYASSTGATAGLKWKITTTVNTEAKWQFEVSGNSYYVKNCYTNSYLNTAKSNSQVKLSSSKKVAGLTYVGDGQFTIAVSSITLYARQSRNYIIASNGGKDSPAAWYIKEVSSSSSIAAFGERDGDEGDATAIESVENDNEEDVIYDITGRRIQTIDKSGLYLVNGKKMYIRK